MKVNHKILRTYEISRNSLINMVKLDIGIAEERILDIKLSSKGMKIVVGPKR
jgi:hypothetical protein